MNLYNQLSHVVYREYVRLDFENFYNQLSATEKLQYQCPNGRKTYTTQMFSCSFGIRVSGSTVLPDNTLADIDTYMFLKCPGFVCCIKETVACWNTTFNRTVITTTTIVPDPTTSCPSTFVDATTIPLPALPTGLSYDFTKITPCTNNCQEPQ